jgi:hypothetical protein
MAGWRMSLLLHFPLTVFIAACATIPMVNTNVEVFHDLPSDFAGKRIAIISADPNKTGTLEYRTYADKLAERMMKVGFEVVAPNTEPPPDYVAALGYGVGTEQVVAAATSGGIAPDYAGGAHYAATSTVVNAYPRALIVNIVALPRNAGEEPRQVYMMKALSTGQCRTLSAVIDPILDAVFDDFPGKNGTSRTHHVPSLAGLSC